MRYIVSVEWSSLIVVSEKSRRYKPFQIWERPHSSCQEDHEAFFPSSTQVWSSHRVAEKDRGAQDGSDVENSAGTLLSPSSRLQGESKKGKASFQTLSRFDRVTTCRCTFSPSSALFSQLHNGEISTSIESGVGFLMNLRKAANHPLLIRQHYDNDQIRVLARLLKRDASHKDANEAFIREDLSVMSDFYIHKTCLAYRVSFLLACRIHPKCSRVSQSLMTLLFFRCSVSSITA